MQEFFRGWRRSLGVLTLLLACLVVAALVRGNVATDRFLLGNAKGYQAVEVRESCLLLGRVQAFGNVSVGPANFWTIFPKNRNWGSALYGMHLTPTNEQWEWRWNRFGFDFGRTRINNGGNDTQLTLWAIPYWSIILPLTLLSAWLLFSKARTTAAVTTEDAT